MVGVAMNAIKFVSLLVGVVALSGCASEKGHWECMVYNPATNTVMTEEQYKQWTVDNNVEYVPPQNGVGALVGYPSPNPHVIHYTPRPVPTSIYAPIPTMADVMGMIQAMGPTGPVVSNIGSMPSKRGTGAPSSQPKDQNKQTNQNQQSSPGVYNGNVKVGDNLQLGKGRSATKSSPAQPAQQPQQTSTTVAQGNTWEQIYRSAAEGNPQAQYQLGVGLVTGRGVAKNYNAGVEWLRKSAMQGYAPAREVLTKLYQGIMR